MSKEIFTEVINKSPNRRSFVRKLGLASAAVGVASALKPSKLEAQPAFTDADILNFALNLEYLEAEFYTVATTGMTIDNFGVTISGTGNAGATTGGSQVTFPTTNHYRRMAEELAIDERTHVALLQNAIISLGADPIAKPAINLNALGFGFGSTDDFLKLARIFEDIGVTAYGGAAPLITDKTILGYAARILATEALHAGLLRLLVAQNGIPTTPLDQADIIPPVSGIYYFSTDSDALTEVRTPGQVLYLAYGAAPASSGGFFPQGVNGNPALTMSTGAASNDTATLTASPNPIPLNGASSGATTISWNAPDPAVQYIEIHVGSPTGPLFTANTPIGSMMTGNWVYGGELFYLQDITNGKALTANNTLAILPVYTD